MPGRNWLIAQLDAMHQSRGGDWYYRTFAPGQAMAALPGVYVVNVDQAHRKLPVILERADVLIVNNVCTPDLLPIFAERRRAGKLTLFEINDDVEQMQPTNPLAAFFEQPENQRLYRRLALSADALQFSAPELFRLFGFLNQRARVFENQIVTLPALRRPGGASVRLGWGGSAGHFDDLAAVAEPLMELVRSEPSVTLCLMCSDRIWKLFDQLPNGRKERTPVGSIFDYYDFVSRLDIGIAPNLDCGFNRARSDVKFLEYAACGAVAVMQRLAPYTSHVRHAETGFLFDTPRELTSTLSRLIADAVERQRVREAAHRYVREQRLQADHAAERLDFYAELLPQSPASSEPAAVFAELASLAGAEVSGRHVMLAHTAYEARLHDGLLLLQGGTDRARGAALLREAAELEPSAALPSLFLGVTLESEADLRAAVEKNPRSVQAALSLGQHHLRRGELRPALSRFLAVAELAPGYEIPYALAARALSELGAAAQAAEFEKLAEQMAQTLARPEPPASPATEPAWRLLERAGHLETLNPNYAPQGLLELIASPPRRVLDVGCFCGGSGRFLKRRFADCQLVGIELLEQAAAMAAEVYEQVHVGALEQLDFAELGLTAGSFDAIIAADVLEHLFNPWQALMRLQPLLAPGGALYVSLPNARNLKLLSELGRGRFDYAGAGILDVTHVRFFTRDTAVEMLEQTGYRVDDVRLNADRRLAAVFSGVDLQTTKEIELDGLRLGGLTAQDLLELAALQLYLVARSP